MSQATIEDLKKVIALSDLPEEHLQWILDHTRYYEVNDGDCVMKTGEPAEELMFIIEGKLSFYMNVNGRLVYYFTFENDKSSGGATGLLPYSRMKISPGNSYAVGKLRSVRMHKSNFPAFEQLNPDLIQKLIGYMTERARAFATTQLQHEKVNALGQLAAGIAHELNNPASAIDRISSELIKRLQRNYGLTEKLLQHQISATHIQNIRSMVEAKENDPASKTKLSPRAQMEKEDEITDWLEQQGLLGNHIAGETFAEAGFTGKDLEIIRGHVGKDAFIHVLHWLENLLSSQKVIKDLGIASTRISHLVSAIKSHVHMDRTNELQPTNIHTDLENTITLLGYKLRDKNVSVKKNFCDNLQEVPAYVGELNQVWTNLIDNAIFAMSKGGELTVETACNSKEVTVKIIDSGTGIPPEIVNRIFDPFFTTKKVGEGTGIGLDLVMRIIKRHNGEIKVHSVPGKTEFCISIPFVQNEQKNIQH
jgi:signal transduction histidine kinase